MCLHEHDRAFFLTQLLQILRTFSPQRHDRFFHFQDIADGISQRIVHVAEHGLDIAAEVSSDFLHAGAQLFCLRPFAHERTFSVFDIEQDGAAAGGDLLGHDAGSDQRQAVHGPAHITQCIQHAVSRHQFAALGADGQADLLDLPAEGIRIKIGAQAGNRFELVDRPAGMAQTAPAHLGDCRAAGRDERSQHERRLVPDAAAGMLVTSNALDAAEIHRFPAADHRVA